ncbi:MAG: damage-control phosphatase, subfamily [Thermoanaerobacterium sp.]|nr:damage-control phosphatase, subfamily [Thermoanaerobacterium sp.]
MKLYLECIPCFLRHTLFATKDQEEEIRATILKKVVKFLYEVNWDISHDEIVNEIYNLIREETKIVDPYKDIKKESNNTVLKLYPLLKSQLSTISNERERLYTAAKLSIAGNIIDFGPSSDFDLDKTINDVLNKKLAIDDFDILFNKILTYDNLLFFADNAGEIVFDKIFIEEMINVRKKPFSRIAFVVKGGPIINDAMLDDVYETGINKFPNIIFYKLGNGVKGTGPNRKDKEVKDWIKNHDIVISKGQGNYEGLSENKNVFFMLISKCPVISKDLNVEVMDAIIKYNA